MAIRTRRFPKICNITDSCKIISPPFSHKSSPESSRGLQIPSVFRVSIGILRRYCQRKEAAQQTRRNAPNKFPRKSTSFTPLPTHHATCLQKSSRREGDRRRSLQRLWG